jgi:hypothetical protein
VYAGRRLRWGSYRRPAALCWEKSLQSFLRGGNLPLWSRGQAPGDVHLGKVGVKRAAPAVLADAREKGLRVTPGKDVSGSLTAAPAGRWQHHHLGGTSGQCIAFHRALLKTWPDSLPPQRVRWLSW